MLVEIIYQVEAWTMDRLDRQLMALAAISLVYPWVMSGVCHQQGGLGEPQ